MGDKDSRRADVESAGDALRPIRKDPDKRGNSMGVSRAHHVLGRFEVDCSMLKIDDDEVETGDREDLDFAYSWQLDERPRNWPSSSPL